MTIILGGNPIDTSDLAPGFAFRSISYHDDRRVPRATDFNDRREAIVGIVLHTVHGKLGELLPGGVPDDRDISYAKYQAGTDRDVSWDFTVGRDGDVVQSNDPAVRYTWHAGTRAVNAVTLGVEAVQESAGDQYADTMAAQVALCELLCERLHIPRVTPVNEDGTPFRGLLRNGAYNGVYGHRNIAKRKGEAYVAMKGLGDPGDWVFDALLDAGFLGEIVEVPSIPPRVGRPTGRFVRVTRDAGTGARVVTGLSPSTYEAVVQALATGADPDDAAARTTASQDAPRNLPAWIDPAREVVYTPPTEVPGSLAEFVARHYPILTGTFGLNYAQAVGVIAHAATETARGAWEVGNNAGGVKLRQSDDVAYKAKHGHGLAWWTKRGHEKAGDAAWVVYRGFDSTEDFWAFWLKRYVPRPAHVPPPTEVPAFSTNPITADYTATGRAFWAIDTDVAKTIALTPWDPPVPVVRPDAWFVEMLLAGYRGSQRRDEVLEAIDDGVDLKHPSVRTFNAVCREVFLTAYPDQLTRPFLGYRW